MTDQWQKKGVTVIYRDSQYKKKVRIFADLGGGLEDGHDMERSIRKLDKRVTEYFGFKYGLNNFTLSGMVLSADIDIGNHENVLAYLKVLQRIGKVKGFSPSDYDCFDESTGLCLDGNSNGIAFWIYDLEQTIKGQLRKTDLNCKKIKSLTKETEGILHIDVKLAKPKAIHACSDASEISGQLLEMSEKSEDVFLETFTCIVPFGDFYKKDKAEEIIRSEVKDRILKRKMLRLLALIPEKKWMYLAQKELNCRNIEKVMKAFAEINLSPVTISKRHDVKYLKGLYEYLLA